MLNKVRSQLLVSGQLKDEDKESREHRESLRRNKSSSSSIGPDEEQDLALVGGVVASPDLYLVFIFETIYVVTTQR